LLFNDNSQVHAWVNGTVQVEGSCCVKRANLVGIVALELHINGGGTGLLHRFWGPIHPGAILNDMDN
jgi:hypothetical protein